MQSFCPKKYQYDPVGGGGVLNAQMVSGSYTR